MAGSRNGFHPGLRSLIYLILFSGLLIAVFPFLWMFFSSFKTNSMIFRIPITFLPDNPMLTNYKMLFSAERIPFLRQFANSAAIVVMRVLLNLLACSFAAYAFAKYKFPLRNFLFLLVISFLMVPQEITIVPLFLLMHGLRWLDTLKAVALPGAFTAFGVFFMRQVMVGSVPNELIESARIDGAGEFRTFFGIVLPLAEIKSGLIVLATITFVNSWNEYLWPVIALRSSEKFTLPVGLATLVNMYKVEYGMIMAGGVLAIMPVVILFLLGRNTFMQGFTAGALKG